MPKFNNCIELVWTRIKVIGQTLIHYFKEIHSQPFVESYFAQQWLGHPVNESLWLLGFCGSLTCCLNFSRLARSIPVNLGDRNDEVCVSQANWLLAGKSLVVFISVLNKNHAYNLRTRSHNFALPVKDDHNFVSRSLYTELKT